jgi:hypothetical protein
MLIFFILEIYLLFLLPSNGKSRVDSFSLCGSVEYEGENGVNNFLGLITWRLGFLDDNIKAKMMSPLE